MISDARIAIASRDDYHIFRELVSRLGSLEDFSEGHNTRQWPAHLYERTRSALEDLG